MNYIAQIIGIISVILWIYSVQNKKQHKILFFQFLANLGYAIQYLLIKAYSASAMNLSSSLRSLIFSIKRKHKKKISKLWLIFFLISIIILGIITYDGLLSLLPTIITIFYAISSWVKDVKVMRIVFILAAFGWIYYNIQVHAYAAIIGNVFEIISGFISLIRFKKS